MTKAFKLVELRLILSVALNSTVYEIDLGGIITMNDFAQFKPVVHEQSLVNDHFSGDLAMCGPPPPSSFAATQLIISLMARQFSTSILLQMYQYSSSK